IGTSGSVYPAAGFVVGARHAGAHTVELNLEPSDGATLFGEAFYGPATEVAKLCLLSGRESRPQPPCRAPIKNSSLPLPPRIGEAISPLTVQPDFSINSRTLVAASLRFAGSRTIPPLPTPSRPASNCGLTRATSQAPGAARLKATGSTRVRLMKLT